MSNIRKAFKEVEDNLRKASGYDMSYIGKSNKDVITEAERKYIRDVITAGKGSFLKHCNMHNMIYVNNTGIYNCQGENCTCKFACGPFFCYDFILILRRLK